MDRTEALRMLAPAHARALVLDAHQGCDALEIAADLGLDVRSVEPLLHVAREKLAAIEQLSGEGTGNQ